MIYPYKRVILRPYRQCSIACHLFRCRCGYVCDAGLSHLFARRYKREMSKLRETDLYLPVKAHFEGLGYEVKAEVKDADVMAVRRDAPDELPVIIELKTGFSLILLHQAISRQTITDQVYVAVPRWKGRAAWKTFKGNISICKRLGLGMLSVNVAEGTVQVHNEPKPFTPRKNPKRKEKLQQEFDAREGDPNVGGTPGGGRNTAYRQDAEKCRAYIYEHGAAKASEVAKTTGVARARQILASNHYGWFERVSNGIYGITAQGAEPDDV